MMRSLLPNNKKKLIQTAKTASFVLFWLLVWQLSAMYIDNNIIFVTPTKVVQTLLVQLATKQFWLVAWTSFGHIALGVVIVAILGVLLALASHKVGLIKDFLSLPMSTFKAVPVANFIILLFVAMANKSNIPIVIIAMMSLPIIYANVLQGLNSVDKKMVEMSKVFGMSRPKQILYIYVHHTIPYFVTGCRVGIGLSFKVGVSIELIAVIKGTIGEQLYFARMYLMMDRVFVWTVVIIMMSVVFEYFFVVCMKLVLARIDK